MSWLFAMTIALACDSRTEVCWALCRHDGYDTGYYLEKGKACVCGQRKVYEEFTETKLTVPALPPVRNKFVPYTPTTIKKWSDD